MQEPVNKNQPVIIMTMEKHLLSSYVQNVVIYVLNVTRCYIYIGKLGTIRERLVNTVMLVGNNNGEMHSFLPMGVLDRVVKGLDLWSAGS